MAETALANFAPNHVRNIQDKFLNINRERILRTQEGLPANQRDFLDLLPLLFHTNQPELPGYVTQKTPAGISQYSPSKTAIKAVSRHFPSLKLDRRMRHQMDIHALFCMGSSGTIAYSSKSDFDIWLIHASDISEEGLEELTEKARQIEAWSMELRLEVHFFVFDDQTFKQGHHDNLSSESSGSAQHYLLLDEFYRSSLLIAGRIPIWWLVPPDQEQCYEEYIAALFDSNQLDRDDVVDFGDVANIPTDEFFGAAVWQLYKGIYSPYKSVLKLLLMEVYASEHPDIELLSLSFKKAIYNNITEFVSLDPYIMMYKKIEEYLMIRIEKERLDLFRECFYFKINLRMSQKIKKGTINWRRETLGKMLLDWGWDSEKLTTLDSRESWRIDNVIDERKLLVKAFQESYRFLSGFARQHAEVSRVSQAELNILGRKLYAAFERKAGKVEIINRGIAPNMFERELSICHLEHSDGKDRYLLFRGQIDPHNIGEKKPLKRAHSVMGLLAWCHFNQIINSATAISVHSYNLSVSIKELNSITATLEKLFPEGSIKKSSFNDLNKPATAITTGLFINVGVKLKQAVQNENKLLFSDRDDALSYGGKHENLAKSFDLIVATSWEEILIYSYTDIEGLMQCICDYLRWSPIQKQLPPTMINSFCFSPTYGDTISRRVAPLFTTIINSYFGHPHAELTRYVLTAEDSFYITESNEGKLTYVTANSSANLINKLSSPSSGYGPVIFDDKINWHSPIPVIYKLNQPSVIQMFFYVENKKANIFIIDERGSLFNQTMLFYNSQALINHFNIFFSSISKRREILLNGDSLPADKISVEFYLLSKNRKKQYLTTLIEVTPEPDSRSFFNIQVVGDMNEHKQTMLTIYCQDNEFSSLEYGDDIFTATAKHVLKQRSHGETYPIYITDIDLSRNMFVESSVEDLQTIHFLKYKSRIESSLNKALTYLQNT